jgi:hypothetical protein
MASLSQAQAQSASAITRNAITTAQDQLFITSTDLAIKNQITNGFFKVTVQTFQGVNIKTVFSYYTNLGYHVYLPNARNSPFFDPSQLVGYFWYEYWATGGYPPGLQSNPVTMIISWKNPYPATY